MSTINGTGTPPLPPLPPPGPAPIESRPERVDPLAVLRTNLATKAANAELQGRASQIKESDIEQLKKLGIDVTPDLELCLAKIRARDAEKEAEKARKIAERREAVHHANLARRTANPELQGQNSQIKESPIEQLKKLGVDVTVDNYQELPSYAQAKEAFGSNIKFLKLVKAANEEIDSVKSKATEAEKAIKIAERRAAREAAANSPLTVQQPIILNEEVVPDAPEAPPMYEA